MRYPEIDLGLTEEHKALRETMIKFGQEVLRPAGVALDAMDHVAAFDKDSPVWHVFRQYRELGLHKAIFPKALGGIAEDLDAMSHVIMAEELGYADSGLAISLGVSGFPFTMASMLPNDRMQQMTRDYLDDTTGEVVGCWAITEPNHGTDWYLGADDPKCGPGVKAVADGDDFIVNGEKSMWVSNGTIATHGALHVGFDPQRGMDGSGIMILPFDLPGISKSKPLDKLGQRALNQGSIIFEDVRVSKEYVLLGGVPGGPGGGDIMEGMLSRVNGHMSLVFMGLARAAFDTAFKYTQERIQGGVPIFEHKNVKLNLFRMFQKVEAARANAIRSFLYNAGPGAAQPSGCHAVGAKVMSTETAFEVASMALQLHGGFGLSKEYPIEKLFRDGRTAMIEDGVNESLGIRAIDFLADRVYPDRPRFKWNADKVG